MIQIPIRREVNSAIFAYGGAAGRLAEAMNVSIIFMGGSRQGKYRQTVMRPAGNRLQRHINFGCGPWGIPRESVNYNAHNAMSKRKAFELFDAAGVRRPPYVDPLTTTEPYLSRRDHGFDGAGITVQQPHERPVPADFYVKLLPNAAEYRVHAVRYDTARNAYSAFLLQRRVVPSTATSPINSWRHNRCTLERVEIGEINDVRAIDLAHGAFGALRALDMDFGGVDLLVTPDGVVYVLEVNSAPQCAYDRATVGIYASVFLKQWGI